VRRSLCSPLFCQVGIPFLDNWCSLLYCTVMFAHFLFIQGDFKDGKPHGTGVYTFRNGMLTCMLLHVYLRLPLFHILSFLPSSFCLVFYTLTCISVARSQARGPSTAIGAERRWHFVFGSLSPKCWKLGQRSWF
jgi:hypothetical protein